MEPKPIECYKVQIDTLYTCMYLGKMNCKGFLSHRIHKHSTKNKPHISLKWHSMVWTFDQGLYFKMNNHYRHLENSVLTCSWTICGCVSWQLLDKNQKSAQKDCCYTVPLDSSVPYTCKEVIQTCMTMNTKMIDHIIIL